MKIKEKEFKQIVNYVKIHFGIDLSHKKSLVHNRMENYLVHNGYKSFEDFYNFMIMDKTGEAASILINKLSTNHTFFFREEEHFDFLKQNVLPFLKDKERYSKDMRTWSAGCSTGEEAYTIAITLNEFFGEEKHLWDTKILATDISEEVLNKARTGKYSNQKLDNLSDYFKNKYFQRINKDEYMLKKIIKDEVIFRRFNFMNSVFPFRKKFHIIFCRNVMIYFDEETKKELIDKFYEMTEPGGYLFIGHSESINSYNTRYKYISPSIYRKE